MRPSLPSHWPPEVLPPGAPDWETSAVGWLFDLVPGEYRGYEVLRRHPRLLARFAAEHVEACLQAARHGWRTLRGDLGALRGGAGRGAANPPAANPPAANPAAADPAGSDQSRSHQSRADRAREDRGAQFPPEVVEAAMTAYEREGARLAELVRSVAVVRAALEGQRHRGRR